MTFFDTYNKTTSAAQALLHVSKIFSERE